MKSEERPIGGFKFWHVGSLQLQRTPAGELFEYRHQTRGDIRLNRFAEGPFCNFSLPAAPHARGVYAVFVGGVLKYIGECVDLAKRFGSTGYGRISPRNLHRDGQTTNCKLNSWVLAAARQGMVTSVWFCATDENKVLESELISALSPPWNGRIAQDTATERKPQRRERAMPGSVKSATPRHRDANEFQTAVLAQFGEAADQGASVLRIRAGDLHARVGGYPGPHHRMPSCCAAMRRSMQPGDVIVAQPPKGNGANLVIEYRLPRR
jgi:hypothetical protein